MSMQAEVAELIQDLISKAGEEAFADDEGRELFVRCQKVMNELDAREDSPPLGGKYVLRGPEGMSDHPEGYYTLTDLVRAAVRFMFRFQRQGYYSTTRMERIPWDEIGNHIHAECEDAPRDTLTVVIREVGSPSPPDSPYPLIYSLTFDQEFEEGLEAGEAAARYKDLILDEVAEERNMEIGADDLVGVRRSIHLDFAFWGDVPVFADWRY